MKKRFLPILIVFFLFTCNYSNSSNVSFEEVEKQALQGNQTAMCEVGIALLTGSFGNMHDHNYKKIDRDVENALVYLEKSINLITPDNSTYSFIVDALNALGSYYEIEADNNDKAIDYYRKSADLFVRFGGDFEGIIAGRNYNRLRKLVAY